MNNCAKLIGKIMIGIYYYTQFANKVRICKALKFVSTKIRVSIYCDGWGEDKFVIRDVNPSDITNMLPHDRVRVASNWGISNESMTNISHITRSVVSGGSSVVIHYKDGKYFKITTRLFDNEFYQNVSPEMTIDEMLHHGLLSCYDYDEIIKNISQKNKVVMLQSILCNMKSLLNKSLLLEHEAENIKKQIADINFNDYGITMENYY